MYDNDVSNPQVLADRVRTVLKFMNSRDQRPLWSYEQITPLTLKIESGAVMNTFLSSVSGFNVTSYSLM